MNNLFSEIFGCYYKVITEIVNNAPLSMDEIKNIIKRNGFTESCFHLLPKLETLPFIKKRDGKYYSLLENKIRMPITNIEKSWLKAISQDSRFELFAENYDKSKLKDIEPLYRQEQFKYYDKYSDGDDFRNNDYKKHFHKINKAIENCELLKIIYQSPKRDKITIGYYIPLRFEFSSQDDKFRFIAAKILNKKVVEYVYMNLGRIIEIHNSNKQFDVELDFDKNIEKISTGEPITVEIYNDRNAIERFMIEFSTYRKNSRFDEETQTCESKIYYDKADEVAILIKLLSFGPTIKVLGPEKVLVQLKSRIQKQLMLINR